MNDILQYKGYYASINFSASDEVFAGKVLGINDLINFEGASVSELKKGFKEALDDYLQTCSRIGKTPEKTYKGSFNVRVSPKLHQEASTFAAIHNITLNEFVKTALSYALKQKENVSQILEENNNKLETA
jgi:predicted HicB family RNase H-like nuclease